MNIWRSLVWVVGSALAVFLATVEGLDAPVVATEEGRVVGLQERSTKGTPFYSYYSIPFARPPVGDLRFQDPVPAERWVDTLDARSPPAPCLHLPFLVVYTGNKTLLGREDCLYLNVFTRRLPNDAAGNDRPVLVFIHGGGFFAGSTSRYPPHVLLNENVVLVTVQYRLGILGFLSTEDNLISGNFGLKDQTEALRWVKRNIKHFGGDPSKVTIFGESAGGASVHFQMLTPKAKGLFARAILQSGTAMCPWSLGAVHREVAQHTSKLVKCPSRPSPEMLRCLQGVPGEDLVLTLLEYFEFLQLPILLAPRVDGDYLPDEPEALMRDGAYSKMDVISGITSHEGALFGAPIYAKDHIRKPLVEDFVRFGPIAMDFNAQDLMPLPSAQTIFNYYLGGVNMDQTNADSVTQMFSDRLFGVCHDLTTILFTQNSNKYKTFRYELEYRGQHSKTDFYNLTLSKNWVAHADDLFYLFTGEIWLPLTQPNDLKLRDIFTKLWANFAATGNPTPDDSLGFVWEQASESNLHYLSLSPDPVMKPDKRKQVLKFFGTLPTRQNQILQDKYPSELLTSPPTSEVPPPPPPSPTSTVATPTTPIPDDQDLLESPSVQQDYEDELHRKPTKIPRDEL